WLQAPQQAAGSPAAQAATEQGALVVGKPVERAITGSERHRFRLRLDAGQLLKATVEQKGVDVVVTLIGPDGAVLLEIDSPNGANGPEPVEVVAEAAGEYRLEVRTLGALDRGGRYEARVEEVRAATKQDRQLVEARKLYGRSIQLAGEGKSPEALALAERGVELMERALGASHADLAMPLLNLGDLYRRTGQYAKAKPLLERGLALREK